MDRARCEWLLVNLGTPAAPTAEAVRAFLAEFLSDPRVVDFPRWLWQPILRGIVLRTRPPKTAELYRAIWTPEGSPLAAATARLVDALQERAADGLRVRAAYRYGAERVDRVLQGALERAESVVITPLFPQRTASSSGTIEELVHRTAGRCDAIDRVRLAPLAPEAPGYIEALAASVRAAEARLTSGPPEHLLVSFHGIPERVDRREGGRYRADCTATHRALLAALGRDESRATLAFQSKFGPGAWLTPATDATLVALAEAGVRRVVVATPGFLTPGLETIEELGLRGRKSFLEAGGEELRLADPPGSHVPCWEALEDSARM